MDWLSRHSYGVDDVPVQYHSSSHNTLQKMGKEKDKEKIAELKNENRNLKEMNARLEDIANHSAKMMRNFLRENGAQISEQRHVDDDVKLFCNYLVREKNKAKGELETSNAHYNAQYQRAERLESEMRHRTRELQEAHKTITEYGAKRDADVGEILKMMEDMGLEKDREKQEVQFKLDHIEGQLRYEMNQQLEAKERHWRTQLAQWEQDRGRLTHNLNVVSETKDKQHLDELDKLVTHFDDETKGLRQEIEDLKGDLLSQTDDFRPATDQALKARYGELQRLIGAVSLPANLNLDQTKLQYLDKHGFIRSHGTSSIKFFLQSLLWDILFESFFSMPYGFGFCGIGQAQKELLDIHDGWRRLYEAKSDPRGMEASFPPLGSR
jgi:DNA repair exonuclease SbcCD ATPase subunit